MQGQKLELRYTTTPTDYAAMLRVTKFRPIERLPSMIGVVVIWMLLGMTLVDLSEMIIGDEQPRQFYFAMMMLAICIGVYFSIRYFVLQPLIMRSLLEGTPYGLGEARFQYDETGYSTSVESTSMVAKWAGTHVTETKTHLFLFPTRLIGHIIPKRAFEQEADLFEFLALARKEAKMDSNESHS